MDIKKEAEQLLDKLDYTDSKFKADYDKNIKAILSYTEHICREQREACAFSMTLQSNLSHDNLKRAVKMAPLLTDK